MRKRLFRLLGIVCGVLAAGLIYAAAVQLVGFGIPCLFYTVTGWLCPGCGVSRMCMALLRLDLAAAFHYNAAILLLLPIGGVLALRQAWLYVKTGRARLSRIETAMIVCMIVFMLVFGVWRNIGTNGL